MTRQDFDRVIASGDVSLISSFCLLLWEALQECEERERQRDVEES